MDQRYILYSDYLKIELQQAAEEGKDITVLIAEARKALSMTQDDKKREAAAKKLLEKIAKLPTAKGFPFVEPSTLKEIQKARPGFGNDIDLGVPLLEKDALIERIYGAWLGRCAGCLLGKPVEGVLTDDIVGFLKATDNYPVTDYLYDAPKEIKEKYNITGRNSFVDQVDCAPEDDDTNYTVLSLKLMEEKGLGFQALDVAERWLSDIPALHMFTAERVAYRNFLLGIYPPDSAVVFNPYREWIGAQIRGDFFGYVTPGNPSLGAALAFRDASISHTKNGIYGEMFVSAMLSWASISRDVYDIVNAGLGQIPKRSRLASAIAEAMNDYSSGMDFDDVNRKVHRVFDEKNAHHWCHTISNAVIVVNALLYGEGNFAKTIGYALIQGFDTDCNAATAGSILGMMIGRKGIPTQWTAPLAGRLKSGIDGFHDMKIIDLVMRTYNVYENQIKPSLPK